MEGGYGLLSEETEALHPKLSKRPEAASSSYSAAVNFLQNIYLVLVAKNHYKVRSRCLVHEFSFKYIFNNIYHEYSAAILKKSSLWVLPPYMVVATYCYYKKESRMMHTAIVLYLIKKESQLNEVCLGHRVRRTEFIRWRTRAQLLMIYKISTYLCPRDERESLKKLNTSPGKYIKAYLLVNNQNESTLIAQ